MSSRPEIGSNARITLYLLGMSMNLDHVVPFGRSFDEYRCMFGLTGGDGGRRILGVGDGPASFNAAATRQGWRVVSVDPLYSLAGTHIRERFYQVVDDIIGQVNATPDDWVWTYHADASALRRHRESVLDEFLDDLDPGLAVGRYRVGELPELEFDDGSFELALCSHFLFLYSELFDLEFHVDSLSEMLRVADEARVFPLLELNRNRSRHLDGVVAALRREGHSVSIERVEYELQKGGNEMLIVRRGDGSERMRKSTSRRK